MRGPFSKPSFERPSKAYLAALEDCKKFHATDTRFAGDLVWPNAKVIKHLIEQHGCKSMLDYGAGKGVQYTRKRKGKTLEEFWGIPVTKYDPAWPPYAAEPTGTFDIVICTHTLGSIPPQDMAWVVKRLYGFAAKVLFVAEIIGPMTKQVFRNPDSVSIGLRQKDWVTVLSRPHAIDVWLATRPSTGGDPAYRKVRST